MRIIPRNNGAGIALVKNGKSFSSFRMALRAGISQIMTIIRQADREEAIRVVPLFVCPIIGLHCFQLVFFLLVVGGWMLMKS